MEEIREVWQALRRMMPQAMRRPDTLQKYARLQNPKKLRATRDGHTTILTGVIWVRMPSKRANPKPQVLPVQLELTGFELTSTVNIDVRAMVQQGSAEELLKAMFLATLLSLGIFTNNAKQQAFIQSLNL